MKTGLKEELLRICLDKTEERIQAAQAAMDAAQESANHEEKSSAGDKYETSRAMGQLSRDMNARQLAEAQKDLLALKKLNLQLVHTQVLTGSYAETSSGNYFIAAGIGMVDVHGLPVVVVSPASPVARAIMGKGAGDKVVFNGKTIQILSVC